VIDLAERRRFFAEEIEAIANLRSPALVEALAAVPRERFLPEGPWTVRSEADLQAPLRQTPDAEPRRVYHNLAIAIDAPRMLFNGAPSLLGMAIDALALGPAGRVLHVGAGAGYYTAIIGHVVGADGRVVGIEVDEALAGRAKSNVADLPWIEIRHGNAAGPLDEPFDAILVNAGVTHPEDAWLDAVAPGGRLIFPLTASMPAMGAIGKGPLVLATRSGDSQDWEARILTFVAIYSAVGLRNEAMNTELGRTLAKSPMGPIKRLRRDVHAVSPACWLHAPTFCLGS
jgi:protein-L-isoaspartate(D-aspartate) O-methyltransferase